MINFLLRNSDVCVCVNFGDVKGPYWRVRNGVRQGGILSPLLFHFYINEVLENISKLNVGCFLGIRPVDILCYADDIVLCAPSQSGLQILINKTCDILNVHCLPLNDKSEYIVFACRRFHNFSYSVLIDGCIFNNIDETKYLGAILSSDFKLDHDINRSCFSFLKQYNAVFHRFSFLDKNILSFLIHSHCMSFYGVETWFDYRNKNILRGIGVAHHKAVKRLAGMDPWPQGKQP